MQPAKLQKEPDAIDGFLHLLQEGIDTWQLAGAVLVKLREKDRSVFSEIIRRAPTLTVDMLMTLERVGLKQLHPRLLMNAAMPVKRLMGYPYEEQERLCSEPIDVVASVKNGKPVVVKKMVKDLSRLELQRVLGETKLRTIEEQAEMAHTNEGNAEWKALNKAVAERKSAAKAIQPIRAVTADMVLVGRWAVRTIGNNCGFERTNAQGIDPVAVVLQEGVRVVEVYKRKRTA